MAVDNGLSGFIVPIFPSINPGRFDEESARGGGRVLQFAGNRSDWTSKRRKEEAPAKAEKPKPAPDRPREKKLKFSFDRDIAALEARIEENETEQAACGSDYVQLQAQLAELEAALEAKTERWLYLTELKKIDARRR